MSQSGIYSELKMVRWYAKEGHLPLVPKQVELIISDECNESCNFCAFRLEDYTNTNFAKGVELSKYGHNNPKRMIPRDRALSLIEEIKRAGVLGLQLTGGGEATVHPYHEEIFQRGLDVGLKCSLVSNGLRWSEKLSTEILPRFSWVRVSIDAGHTTTYSNMRRTPASSLQKVVRNVSRLAGAIMDQESDCVLGIGFVVTPDNWEEIITGVSLAKSTGAKYVRMSAFFNPENAKPFKSFWRQAKNLIAESKDRYEDGSFKVHDLFGDRLQDLVDGRPDFDTCSYQFYTHFIGGDLKPYRCCVTSYSDHGHIAGADYSKVPFDVFWKSEERKKDFKNFKAPSCIRCQFSNKNRAMQYIINETAPHEEFP